MNFEANQIYHVYNRGNQRQTIFFEQAHYLLFLKKIREQLLPVCDILTWCLMPNHFHLVIEAKPKGCLLKASGLNEIQEISDRIGILLSGYSQIINNARESSGSLFQKKTKAKLLDNPEYIIRCMHYIHQNPLVAGLPNDTLEGWKFSSFSDYCGLRKGTLCNAEKLFSVTGYNKSDFLKDSYGVIGELVIKEFY